MGVVLCILKKHKWINRGFLKGPLLPIYGSGAVVVLISTLTVENNLLLVFVIGMIICNNIRIYNRSSNGEIISC